MKKPNNKSLSVLLILVAVGLFMGIGLYVWRQREANSQTFVSTDVVDNYQECLSAGGNGPLLSNPPKCEYNGEYFTEGE